MLKAQFQGTLYLIGLGGKNVCSGVLLFDKAYSNPVVKTFIAIENVNFISVQIKLHKKITVRLVYKPLAQTTGVDERFHDHLAEICNEQDSIKVGDFNILVPKWGQSPSSSSGCELLSNFALWYPNLMS